MMGIDSRFPINLSSAYKLLEDHDYALLSGSIWQSCWPKIHFFLIFHLLTWPTSIFQVPLQVKVATELALL